MTTTRYDSGAGNRLPAPSCASAAAGPQRWSAGYAYLLLTELLDDQPNRLAHSLLAGRQARSVAGSVVPAEREMLVAAALLHDIGYAPALVRSGFHPLDGADHLLRLGAPERLAALVAHHSEARHLAAARGLAGDLTRFPREEGPLADALVYADMTAGPTGTPMTVADRLDDIAARHRDEDPALRAARLARAPHLVAAAERVRGRVLVGPPVVV